MRRHAWTTRAIAASLSSVYRPVQPCVMRPSRVTPVASTTTMPGPDSASWPRWIRCQSVIEPSSAEYWHIGDTTMRFGSVTPPSWIGVKSLGCGKRDSPVCECLSDFLRERHRARLIAVQAQRVGGDRHTLAGQAGDIALLHHRQRLLHRLRLVLDHAAGLVARRERAVVGIAAVGEHFAGDRNACLLCNSKIFAVR